jgi:alpha-tubulin suppressor-like RCC1 family protein
VSQKYPGGIISKTAPVTVGPVDGEGGSAPGIWTLTQALELQKQNLWPKPVLPKELFSWGRNNEGSLGLGDTVYRSSPVQVGALTDWAKITAGLTFGAAIKADGTLWSWGANANGQLGLGNVYNSRSSPVQVGSLTNWYEVSAGSTHCLATKTDGTLWSWGSGTGGKLGLNNTISRSSPVQIGALTEWADIVATGDTSLAIKTNGTLWSWGYGSYGSLGLGNTTNYSSPKQVGALTNWSKVCAGDKTAFAVKTDGSIWCWGRNHYGQLGLGNTTNYSSPKQIGSLTTWAKVSSSDSATFCVAIKTDGTLWAWGRNQTGQLGQGNTTNRSSPVQTGALTTWAQAASGGNEFCIARKSDGTLWSWGSNGFGFLGLNNTTAYYSPKQIGALTTWRFIPKNMNGSRSLALKTT